MSVKIDNNVVNDIKCDNQFVNQIKLDGQSVYARNLGKIGKFYLLGGNYPGDSDWSRTFYNVNFYQNASLEPTANLPSNILDYDADEYFNHIDSRSGQLILDVDYNSFDGIVSTRISNGNFYYKDINNLSITLHSLDYTNRGPSSVFYFTNEKKTLRNKTFKLDKPNELDKNNPIGILKKFDIYEKTFNPFTVLSTTNFDDLATGITLTTAQKDILKYFNPGNGTSSASITYYSNGQLNTTITLRDKGTNQYDIIADNDDSLTFIVRPSSDCYLYNLNSKETADNVTINLSAKDWRKNWMGKNGWALLRKLPNTYRSLSNLKKWVDKGVFYSDYIIEYKYTNKSKYPVYLIDPNFPNNPAKLVSPGFSMSNKVTTRNGFNNLVIEAYNINADGSRMTTDKVVLYPSEIPDK